MGNRVFVYMEGMELIPEKMQECLEKADRDIESLRNDMAELDKMWEGPAHDAFSREFKESVNDMEDIINRYRKLKEFEETAYEEYSKANQSCADSIATLR
jgi:WXG100 family type VII secretion target